MAKTVREGVGGGPIQDKFFITPLSEKVYD